MPLYKTIFISLLVPCNWQHKPVFFKGSLTAKYVCNSNFFFFQYDWMETDTHKNFTIRLSLELELRLNWIKNGPLALCKKSMVDIYFTEFYPPFSHLLNLKSACLYQIQPRVPVFQEGHHTIQQEVPEELEK